MNLPPKKASPPLLTRQILRRKLPAFAMVALFSLCVNLLMLTGPLFMLQVYARVLPSNSISTLAALYILVVILFVTLGLLDMTRARILARAGAWAGVKLRERLYDVIIAASLRNGGSSAAAAPMGELDTMTGFLSGPAVTILYDAPMVPVYLFFLYLLHPDFLAFGILASLALFALALFNDLISRKPQRQSAAASEKARNLLFASVRNAEALKALGMISRMRGRWRARHDDALFFQTRARERISTVTAASRAFRLLIQSSILALGAWLVVRGEIHAGTMIAASIILGRALNPVEQAIGHWRSWQRYRMARAKVDAALKAHAGTPDPRTIPEPHPAGNLSVDELHVAPPGARKPWLRNISFRLPAGALMVIRGANGSGKTMLARALAGVWPPMHGSISLDGADYRLWPREVLGRLTGYLPQDVELLEGTVRDNISRLDPDAKDEDVLKAARRAGAHELIKQIGGYDAPVGPGGAFLSAGQRQRIALARALYGAPALVILDEPNSNLDAEGERALLQTLARLRQEKISVILIDHGESTMRLTDYLLVLKSGQLLAAGPRDKVLQALSARREADARGAPPAPATQDAPSGGAGKS